MPELSSEGIEQALRQHDAFLRGLAVSLLGDEHLADDVVQTTWLTAIESRPSVRSWRAWAGTVVRHVASNVRRGCGRRAKYEAEANEAAGRDALDVALDAQEQASQEEALRAVTQAVLALGEPSKSVVMMRFFEGLMPQEIARRQGVPLATVKSRLQRALQTLRASLSRGSQRDGGAAWRAGLVALVGNQPIVAALGSGAAGTAATSFTKGVVAVSSKAKFSVAVFAVLIVAGAIVLFDSVANGPQGVAPPASQTGSMSASMPDLASMSAPSSEPGALSLPRTLAQAPGFGSVELRVVYKDGDEPAPGVGVRVHAWGDKHAHLLSRRLRADDAGRLTIDRVHCGRLGIYGDRGGFVSVDLDAAVCVGATLTIPRGVDVVCEVVDKAGNPVSGAEVWLSDSGNFENGGQVGTADPSGRLLLRSVSTQHAVMARKRGYAPSTGVWIQGSVGDKKRVRLVLPSPGAAVRVTVEDESGKPVVGARVRVAADPVQLADRTDGMRATRSIQYLLVTGDDGSCIADCVAPGKATVMANAVGYAPWQMEGFEAKVGDNELRAQLVEGAVLVGTARLHTGEPAAGITVRIGRYGEEATREAKTAFDGSYRVVGVGVVDGRFGVVAYAKGVGKVRASLEATEGATVEWNPVLDPGRMLRGRIVDQGGNGIAGCMVNVRDPRRGSQFWAQATTDVEGRFEAVNCPDAMLVVQVIEDRSTVVFAEAAFENLVADGSEHELRLSDNQRSTAWLSGRVLDRDRNLGALAVTLWRSRPYDVLRDIREVVTESRQFWSEVDTGRFRIGPLAPGRYEVTVRGEQGLAYSGVVDLAVRESRDLGDLQVGGPGKLALDLDLPEGLKANHVWLLLESRHRQVGAFRLHERADRLKHEYEVPAGPLSVTISGEIIGERHEVAIHPDKPTRLSLKPRVGAWVELKLDMEPARSVVDAPVFVARVLTPEGHQVAQMTGHSGNRGRTLIMVPPADAYRVAIETTDGRRGEANFGRESQMVKRQDGVPSPPPVLVVVRKRD